MHEKSKYFRGLFNSVDTPQDQVAARIASVTHWCTENFFAKRQYPFNPEVEKFPGTGGFRYELPFLPNKGKELMEKYGYTHTVFNSAVATRLIELTEVYTDLAASMAMGKGMRTVDYREDLHQQPFITNLRKIIDEALPHLPKNFPNTLSAVEDFMFYEFFRHPTDSMSADVSRDLLSKLSESQPTLSELIGCVTEDVSSIELLIMHDVLASDPKEEKKKYEKQKQNKLWRLIFNLITHPVPPDGGSYDLRNGEINNRLDTITVQIRHFYLQAAIKGAFIGLAIQVGQIPLAVTAAATTLLTLFDTFHFKSFKKSAETNANFVDFHERMHAFSTWQMDQKDKSGSYGKVGFLPFR